MLHIKVDICVSRIAETRGSRLPERWAPFSPSYNRRFFILALLLSILMITRISSRVIIIIINIIIILINVVALLIAIVTSLS